MVRRKRELTQLRHLATEDLREREDLYAVLSPESPWTTDRRRTVSTSRGDDSRLRGGDDPAGTSHLSGDLPQPVGASPASFSITSLKLPTVRPITATGGRNRPLWRWPIVGRERTKARSPLSKVTPLGTTPSRLSPCNAESRSSERGHLPDLRIGQREGRSLAETYPTIAEHQRGRRGPRESESQRFAQRANTGSSRNGNRMHRQQGVGE